MLSVERQLPVGETFKLKVLIYVEFRNVFIRTFTLVFLGLCIAIEDQRDDIQLQDLQQPVCGTRQDRLVAVSNRTGHLRLFQIVRKPDDESGFELKHPTASSCR